MDYQFFQHSVYEVFYDLIQSDELQIYPIRHSDSYQYTESQYSNITLEIRPETYEYTSQIARDALSTTTKPSGMKVSCIAFARVAFYEIPYMWIT